MTSLPLWLILVFVAFSGAIGALVRHFVAVAKNPQPGLVRRRITVVNIVGAFFAGGLVAVDHPIAIVLTLGLFGSLTTFSTIAVWWARDIHNRNSALAIKSVFVHVFLGVPAVLVGYLIGQILS